MLNISFLSFLLKEGMNTTSPGGFACILNVTAWEPALLDVLIKWEVLLLPLSLIELILEIALEGRCSFYPHFIDKKTQAEGG